jgi:site-specific DNA-methyltransferase (adenine-specific)
VESLKPGEICTESYLCVGCFDNIVETQNLEAYLKTKFCRFLLLQALSSMNITKDKFCYVPIQDFSNAWTDEALYEKYDLSQEEIDFIESMIKPME